jgi:hypothetical protein
MSCLGFAFALSFALLLCREKLSFSLQDMDQLLVQYDDQLSVERGRAIVGSSPTLHSVVGFGYDIVQEETSWSFWGVNIHEAQES